MHSLRVCYSFFFHSLTSSLSITIEFGGKKIFITCERRTSYAFFLIFCISITIKVHGRLLLYYGMYIVYILTLLHIIIIILIINDDYNDFKEWSLKMREIVVFVSIRNGSGVVVCDCVRLCSAFSWIHKIRFVWLFELLTEQINKRTI